MTLAVVKNGESRTLNGSDTADVRVLLMNSSELRSVDRELLSALRGGDAAGVGDLTDRLGVTATAVRQRIDRLLEMGLIDREKVVAGRGRPTYRYQLTVLGHQRAGANASELADAMWREIMLIDNSDVRQALLSSIAARLGRQFVDQVSDDDSDGTIESRMQRLSSMLADRQIETAVTHEGALPVLDMSSCPYPSLTEASQDRAMCRLEEQMISEALGQPMHLSSCRLDGDSCCQFSAITVDVATP
jgi:predicted ArsR family transcriptional regulator